MRQSNFSINKPGNLRAAIVVTSTILMFFMVPDAVRFIDFGFISTSGLSENGLRSAIFTIFLGLAILFWILSILNKKLDDATKFLLFFSFSMAGIYISGQPDPGISWNNLMEPLILAFIALVFIESIARLNQSEKISAAEKQLPGITKKYNGSKSLKIIKNWLTPSFILLTFVFMVQIILEAPDYFINNFDLTGISPDFLKYYLASFAILFMVAGLVFLNLVIKKVYSSIAVGDIEKRIEFENLYKKFFLIERKKNNELAFDWINKNKVLDQVRNIAVIGLIIAFSGSNMNIDQLYDNTLHFFDPSLNYREHSFLNEINGKIKDIGNIIYDIDEIIIELNESIWSYVNV